MRSDEELRAFLRDELGPRLAHWREQMAQREPWLRGPGDWGLLVVGAAAALWLGSPLPLLLPGVVLGRRAVRIAFALLRQRAAFRQDIFERVVAFLTPGLRYEARGAIPSAIVRGSGLFESFDSCAGEDLVSGRVGSTALRFSEVRLTRRRRGKDKTPETVFRGLFLVADFPKSFRGRVLLLPDRAERTLGAFGRAFQRLPRHDGLALVELEDPAFERHFACYGSDPVETRYLLSPAFMERLVRFRENTGVPLRLALAGESLLLALPLDRDLFGSSWGDVAVDEATLRTWAGDLAFATGIVEDLDLETRIWSKPAPRAVAG